MSNKESFLGELNKTEKRIHTYIKEKTASGNSPMKESMVEIGKSLGFSEATASRGISKLRQMGVVDIIPSTDNTKPNEIIYYGEPDEKKQMESIVSISQSLNNQLSRIHTLMELKDNTIRTMETERERILKQLDQERLKNERLQEVVDKLTNLVDSQQKDSPVFEDKHIIGFTDLGDGTSAFIFKDE